MKTKRLLSILLILVMIISQSITVMASPPVPQKEGKWEGDAIPLTLNEKYYGSHNSDGDSTRYYEVEVPMRGKLHIELQTVYYMYVYEPGKNEYWENLLYVNLYREGRNPHYEGDLNLPKGGKYIIRLDCSTFFKSSHQIKVSFKPDHFWLDRTIVSAINAKWPASDKSNIPKRMQAFEAVHSFRTRGWTNFRSVDEIRKKFAKEFGLNLPPL